MTYSLIDTHCHITCDELYSRIDEVLREAKAHHVDRMLVVCTNFIEYERAVSLKEQGHPIDIALGFHPNDLYAFQEEDYQHLEQLLIEHKLTALGEIGLDYHWDDVKKEDQIQGFIRQIKLAQHYHIPILIHMREATKDTVDILKEYPCHGIMHCYSGSYETALILEKLGFYISFGGPLTFKNSRGAPEVAKQLPLERLMIETDSPYLTPHPFRGRQNEPMYLEHTFHKICEIKQQNEEAVADQLQKNYYQLFEVARNDLDYMEGVKE